MLHKKVILPGFIIRPHDRNLVIIFIHFREKCFMTWLFSFTTHLNKYISCAIFGNKKEDASNSSNKVYYYNYLKPKYEENVRIFIVFLKPHV